MEVIKLLGSVGLLIHLKMNNNVKCFSSKDYFKERIDYFNNIYI